MNDNSSREKGVGSMKYISQAIGFVLLITGASANALLISLASGSNYSTDTATMDAVLGIAGLTIEDFEDVSLMSGLTVEHSNPNAGPTNTLANIYTEPSASFNNNSWDGPSALVNTFDNIIWFPPNNLDKISERITFGFSTAITSFGVGLGNFQSDIVDHAIIVNGIDQGLIESFPNFVSGINIRNGYLLISAETGESINSVAIEMRDNGTSTPSDGDGLIFDHLAFGGSVVPVPEPTIIALFATGLFGLRFARRRKCL
jgi:hypothetical protein